MTKAKDILKKDEATSSIELQSLGFNDGKRARKDLSTLSKGALKNSLEDVLDFVLSSPNPGDSLANIERVIEGAPKETAKKLSKNKTALKKLASLGGSSQYLSGFLAQNPDWLEGLFLEGRLETKKDLAMLKKELVEFCRGAIEFSDMAKRLRIYRNKEYLRIGARDLFGMSSMAETAKEISDLASASLDTGIRFVLDELKKSCGAPYYIDEDGTQKEAVFSVIALGKFGGRELNFLSDIDIIYVYSSDKGETSGVDGKESSKISLHAFFVKLSEKLTKLINQPTGDGFVFRVDLDLRPEGRSGDLANSLRSAEIYYESWGQMWERSAMIKARPVAGDEELGAAFMKMITPFTYRKYLDFTSIEEIKAMKEKIDLAQIRGKNTAINVKLGRGGIREIEFFCQALQLIYGGKNPDVRDNSTLRAMEKLREKDLLSAKDASLLKDGYVFLRNLEHRLQMVEGLQTQNLPEREEEVFRIAKTMGFASIKEFLKALKEKTDSIHDIFRGLFYKSKDVFKEGIPEEVFAALSDDALEKERLFAVKSLGFKDAETALKNALLLRGTSSFLHLSQKARVLLEKLSPLLLFRASTSPDPDMALSNIERFISAAGARVGIYSLLVENTPLITELMKIFGGSAFLSNMLIEKPENLDILLSPDVAKPAKTEEEFMREISDVTAKSADYEQTLDNLRRYKKQELFRIGTKDLLGELSSEDVSTQISSLAGASLEAAYKTAAAQLVKKYGTPGDERFTVLGLGKLGGGELIYGSDLDIIFVYAENPGFEETSGPKVISNHEFYAHAAQKMISILSLRTNEGFLFNVDARLRPSGSSGPLVVSKTALLDYQREKASVWERQALTRVSTVAGDRDFGLDVIKELSGIVYSKNLAKKDVSELLRIRKRMEVEVAKETETRFDIKAGKGGMVDVEFLVQALLLRHGKEKKLRSPNTLLALKNSFEAGILKEKDYNALEGAYKFYRHIETRLRIVHDKSICVLASGSVETDSLAKKMGYKGNAGEKLISDYIKKREEVRDIYLKMMEELSGSA